MIVENFSYFFSKIYCFCNYVSSAQGFPKPLSPEEEKIEVEKMRNGDKAARDKLITHNLRLVAHIVKSYRNSLEADDLLSAGTIGLIKAVDSFDPTKKSQLSTFAARCIHNEILMLIRVNKKHKNVLSLNSLIDPTDDTGIEIQDVLSSDGDEIYAEVENKILFQSVRKIIKEKLTKREQVIIKYRYGIGCERSLSQKEVAQKLGISRSYVSRIETKAINLIKEDFERQNMIDNEKNFPK